MNSSYEHRNNNEIDLHDYEVLPNQEIENEMAEIYNKINGTSHFIIIAETGKSSGGDDSEDPEFAEEGDPEYVRYNEYN